MERPRKVWKFGIFRATDLPRIELVDAKTNRAIAARELHWNGEQGMKSPPGGVGVEGQLS
eukprot:gene2956-1505_t